MDTKLDAFLFGNAEVFCRLCDAFSDCEDRFWNDLRLAVKELCEDALGSEMVVWIDEEDVGDWQAAAYKQSWLLLGEDEDHQNEFDRTPGFWFPEYGDLEQNEHLWALLGFDQNKTIFAEIFATPLSEYLGAIQPIRDTWNGRIGEELARWKPYPKGRSKKPNRNWGLRLPVTLDAVQISEAIESEDLSIALNPLQEAVEDFKRVVPEIDKLVEEVRSTKKAEESSG